MATGRLFALVWAVAVSLASPALGAAGVTLADGTPASEQALATAARGLSRAVDTLQPVALPAVTSSWASTLRLTPCTAEAAPAELAAAVSAARQQISMLDADVAEAALEDAIRRLPCSSEAVDRGDLLAAFEVLGEAAQVAGHEGNARFAYEGLLAVDPSYGLTSPPGTGYDELFNAVRRDFVNQSPSTLGLHHRIAGEASVLWDGAPIEAASRVPLTSLGGRHLLQWNDGAGLRGAWVELPVGGATASLVWGPDRAALLAAGLADVGARAAVEPLLRAYAGELGVEGIAVLPGAASTSGYLVGPELAEPWADSALAVGRTMASDRVRLAVGAGYANLQLTHYGDITAAVDVRLIGGVHLRIEGDLALSQPLDGRAAGYVDQGKVAALPGLGAGVLVHPVRGLIQPFGALTVGMWIGGLDEDAAARLEAALAENGAVMSQTDQDKLGARHAVDFRGFVDGGVDLVPLGGPLLVRVSAGVGLGMAMQPSAKVGFQLRAGAAVGVRFGVSPQRAEGG